MHEGIELGVDWINRVIVPSLGFEPARQRAQLSFRSDILEDPVLCEKRKNEVL